MRASWQHQRAAEMGAHENRAAVQPLRYNLYNLQRWLQRGSGQMADAALCVCV